MKFSLIITVFSILFSACGVEPAAVSKVSDTKPTANSTTDVVTEEQREPLKERPQMGVVTPVLLFLSSAALAGCFVWLQKHCAGKLYQHIVRPHWKTDDWRKYNDFIRTEFINIFDNAKHSSDDFGSGFDDSFKDFDDHVRREYDSVFGEGAWDRNFLFGKGDSRTWYSSKREGGRWNYRQRNSHQRSSGHQQGGYQQSSVSHTYSGRDPYDVFGLSKKATPDEIKAKYHKLAKQYHPDKNPNNKKEAEEKFKELGAAYGELKRQGKAN